MVQIFKGAIIKSLRIIIIQRSDQGNQMSAQVRVGRVNRIQDQ